MDRHAEARHDRVRTRTPTPDREIDREPRETTEPSWIERHYDKTHESNQPTAVCNDGDTSYSLHHRGACSNHGGVAKWLD